MKLATFIIAAVGSRVASTQALGGLPSCVVRTPFDFVYLYREYREFNCANVYPFRSAVWGVLSPRLDVS